MGTGIKPSSSGIATNALDRSLGHFSSSPVWFFLRRGLRWPGLSSNFLESQGGLELLILQPPPPRFTLQVRDTLLGFALVSGVENIPQIPE